MLSRRVTKIIHNLEKKKFREKYNLFKVEGSKLVLELIQTSYLQIETIYATKEWIATNVFQRSVNVEEVEESELSTLSNFQTKLEVLALVKIPHYFFSVEDIQDDVSLLLNGIQDPGNFGTIMRVADWFGIKNIFCDSDCANLYNPKAVQASMGAVFRIKVHYTDLINLIRTNCSDTFPCYGAFLEGNNIYKEHLSQMGFILMGNEGHGISHELEQLVSNKVTIPSFANNELSTESLNVGVATGIILSEFKRNI